MAHDFGVTRLATVPVYQSAEATHQVTQLLFGDIYEVSEYSSDKKWIAVKIYFDGTEGWISKNHHHSITPEYFVQLSQGDFKITLDLISTLLYKKNPLSILLGSIVPISTSELFKMEEQFAFNGEAKSVSQKRDGDFVRSIALKYLNAPEVKGGKTPFGICANGFVQMVFKISGWSLPWNLKDQIKVGKKIEGLASALRGDLVFLKAKNDKIDHVGILLEGHKIVHAFGSVRIDSIDEKGILDAETKTYSHTLTEVHRIINL
ncbi:MAG: C40 family peptidase [Bacteroidetes bacterium]|nr:C40 family peptidase [Bacteroidota bacterium]